MTGYRVPIATYRLQFNRDFTNSDTRNLVPYLHRMGISDLYGSPISHARSGSTHGRDVTDPARLDPELDRQQEFDALVQKLSPTRWAFYWTSCQITWRPVETTPGGWTY